MKTATHYTELPAELHRQTLYDWGHRGLRTYHGFRVKGATGRPSCTFEPAWRYQFAAIPGRSGQCSTEAHVGPYPDRRPQVSALQTSALIRCLCGTKMETREHPIEGFISSKLLPNYADYCPVVHQFFHEQADGTFIVYGGYQGAEIVVRKEQIIPHLGFLVLHLGSVEDEYTVETAANAVFNSLKSLFASCVAQVKFDRIRTSVELSELLKAFRFDFSHLIIIGHGTRNGISFLDRSQPLGGSELSGLLGWDSHKTNLQIISLCCHSGSEAIASGLSRAGNVSEVLAPKCVFDIRWAVHFVTGYFLQLFLEGKSVDEAVHVAALQSGQTPICVWRDGKLVRDCSGAML